MRRGEEGPGKGNAPLFTAGQCRDVSFEQQRDDLPGP